MSADFVCSSLNRVGEYIIVSYGDGMRPGSVGQILMNNTVL